MTAPYNSKKSTYRVGGQQTNFASTSRHRTGGARIYVKIPHDYKGKNLTVPRTENSLAEDSFLSNQGQKIVHSDGRNMPGNKNDINKNNIIRMREQEERTAYGSFLNVFLSGEDYKKLHTDFPECDEYIERLSRYMSSKGKTYQNHALLSEAGYCRTETSNKANSRQETMIAERMKAYEKD